jgi:hypothetical protein
MKKNPFKRIGARIKAQIDKLKMPQDKKAELRKEIVDNFGDGCFIGGLTLLGAAIFAPVATVPTLTFAAIFLAAGTTAKYTAGKMSPNGPKLEKAIPPAPQQPEAEPAPGVQPAAPDFTRAVKRTADRSPPRKESSRKPDPNPPTV